HPEVIQAGINALKKYGAGVELCAIHLWNSRPPQELEAKIAKFDGREDAILYPKLFKNILGKEDAVILDELNHASIIDGLRLTKGVKKIRYKHKNMQDLEERLAEDGQGKRRKLIVTDGVFSMDGNVAPLKDIMRLAQKYDALVFLDECHATGLFGKTGRGTEEFWGAKPVDIINSTLGKALGGAAGGYTTVVGSASKALDLLLASSELTQKVADGTAQFRKGMTDAGFTILGEDHPICPVFVGDARLASQFADKLLGEGIYVIGFSYPVVPHGKARIRVQISASHDAAQIDKLITAFKKIGKELNII
ncbi:2-amino-3-ketobutyrate coenzyme A ligase, mitochondrial, partial [Orchesella cincta]